MSNPTTSSVPVPLGRSLIFSEIAVERAAQDAKWGEQNHPDGTGGETALQDARYARERTEAAAAAGKLTWRHILREEFFEALAEHDPVKLRAELVQVAAVAEAWIEAIDRRLGCGHPWHMGVKTQSCPRCDEVVSGE